MIKQYQLAVLLTTVGAMPARASLALDHGDVAVSTMPRLPTQAGTATFGNGVNSSQLGPAQTSVSSGTESPAAPSMTLCTSSATAATSGRSTSSTSSS